MTLDDVVTGMTDVLFSLPKLKKITEINLSKLLQELLSSLTESQEVAGYYLHSNMYIHVNMVHQYGTILSFCPFDMLTSKTS